MINFEKAKEKCCEAISQIENFEMAVHDLENMWDCHHRLGIELKKSKKELDELDLYYNRPASELIFLTHSEHAKIHGSLKKHQEKLSHEERSEIARKGWANREDRAPWNKGTKGVCKAWNKGKKCPQISEGKKNYQFTEEHKKHIGDAQRGRKQTEETIEKRKATLSKMHYKLSESHKGNSYRSQLVTIKGVTYKSKKEAAKALGVSYKQLMKLLQIEYE